MYDQALLLWTLLRFAAILPERSDLENTLTELTESVTAVLGLCGNSVTMADDGRLRYPTRVIQVSGELELSQAHPSPSQDAYASGEVVRVTDLRAESTRWPEFSGSAARLSVAAGLASQIMGTLNRYSTEPRE